MIFEDRESTVEHLDVFPCPNCNTVKSIIFRSKFEKKTILCTTCGVEMHSYQEWNVVAKWNWNSIVKSKDKLTKHRELYESLNSEAIHNEKVFECRKKRQAILDAEILTKCSLRKGDIIYFDNRPEFHFEVISIKAIYAYNTGPIWIAQLSPLDRNRRQTGNSIELWETSEDTYSVNDVFVVPYKWKHIQQGQNCVVKNQSGIVANVDLNRKKVEVKYSDGNSEIVKSLSEIKIRLDEIKRHTGIK